MRKTFSTVEITCDRCGATGEAVTEHTNKYQEFKDWWGILVKTEAETTGKDLCPNCTRDFAKFMNPPPGNPRIY